MSISSIPPTVTQQILQHAQTGIPQQQAQQHAAKPAPAAPTDGDGDNDGSPAGGVNVVA